MPAFLGPLLAVFLLYWLHADIRSVFYLAVIPGLIAFLLVLLVKEKPAAIAAKAKIDVSLGQFPMAYWRYLLVIALFDLGNSSNAFLILRTRDIGASPEMTILIYAAFNLVAALSSYPAGSLSDKWGGKIVLLLSFIVFLIGYLGFALTQNVVLIAGLFAFYGLFQGMFRTAGKAVALSFVPERLRQRHWLVQHDSWGVAAHRQPHCWRALGSHRACGGVLLRRHLRCHWMFRIVATDSGDTRHRAHDSVEKHHRRAL